MGAESPWYTCPACGNERSPEHADGIHGTGQVIAFLDGAGGWWQQSIHIRLRCPCGHHWELMMVIERDQPVRFEPMSEPPPPTTPEQQRRIDLGSRLRDRRVACHTSLRAAAEVVGLRPAKLSSIERGEAEPSDECLLRMEEFYASREAIPIDQRDVSV